VGSSGERSVPVTRARLGAAAGVLDSSTAAAWVLSKVGAVPVIGACQHGGVGMAVSSCIGRVVSAVLGWVRECWSVWWLACCLLYATVLQCAVCLHAWCILCGRAERCGLLSDPWLPPPPQFDKDAIAGFAKSIEQLRAFVSSNVLTANAHLLYVSWPVSPCPTSPTHKFDKDAIAAFAMWTAEGLPAVCFLPSLLCPPPPPPRATPSV
jgi:hypothetical protein